MKLFPVYRLNSYSSKLYSALFAVACMVGLLLMIVFPKQLNSNPKDFRLVLILLNAAIYMIAFSKERIEDERVERIRGKAFQIAFGITMTTMILVCLAKNQGLNHVQPVMTLEDVFAFTLIGFIIYFFSFYLPLYFSPTWIYNDGDAAYIKKRKIIIFAFGALLLLTLGAVLVAAFGWN